MEEQLQAFQRSPQHQSSRLTDFERAEAPILNGRDRRFEGKLPNRCAGARATGGTVLDFPGVDIHPEPKSETAAAG